MALTKSAEKRISVVVPVRDEEQSIRLLLKSLLEQTRQPNEIVIADTGSKDKTPGIVQEFIDRGAPIKLIRQRAAFPGRGRNVGVANVVDFDVDFVLVAPGLGVVVQPFVVRGDEMTPGQDLERCTRLGFGAGRSLCLRRAVEPLRPAPGRYFLSGPV